MLRRSNRRYLIRMAELQVIFCTLNPIICNPINCAQGSYKCGCPEGYAGEDFSSCSDINECTTGNFKCPPGSSCINTVVSTPVFTYHLIHSMRYSASLSQLQGIRYCLCINKIDGTKNAVTILSGVLDRVKMLWLKAVVLWTFRESVAMPFTCGFQRIEYCSAW